MSTPAPSPLIPTTSLSAIPTSLRKWLILSAALVPLSAVVPTASPPPWMSQAAAQSSNPLRLPSLGDDPSLTLGAERRMGNKIATEIYRDADYLSDPILDDYLAQIWQPLVAAARQQGELSDEMAQQFAWRVFLVRDKSVNAFALPGGFMGVHTGLIAQVESPGELASVLAHEVSHITQRHIARSMGKQAQSTPLMVAAILLGVMAAKNNPAAAQAAIAGSQAATIQHQLNFSRDMEREADRIGLSLMHPAGFPREAFVGMFAQLQKASRLNDNGSFPYLRSHPLTTERIADVQNRLLGQPVSSTKPPDLATHAMMRARARVLSDTSSDALHLHLQKGQRALTWTSSSALPNASTLPSPQSLAENLGDLYAAALASLRLYGAGNAAGDGGGGGGGGASVKVNANAPATAPQLFLQALQARVALQTSAAAMQQVRWLVQGGSNSSEHRVDVLLWAQSAWRQSPQMTQAVLEKIQTWTINHPHDADAWDLQSQIQAHLQRPVRSLMAQAQAHTAHLDLTAALDAYKTAELPIKRAGLPAIPQTPTKDFDAIDAAIVSSKVREMETRVRELSKDGGRGG